LLGGWIAFVQVRGVLQFGPGRALVLLLLRG